MMDEIDKRRRSNRTLDLSPKSSFIGKVHLTRSASDTKAIGSDLKLGSPLQSFDDFDLERTGIKQAALSLSSSSSLPNLSKYDSGPAPDVSSWVDDVDLDLPFEMFDDDSNLNSESPKKRQASSKNVKRKMQQPEIPPGIRIPDKTQFFSREQMTSKATAAAPPAVTNTKERKSQSTTSGSSSHKMDTSSDLSIRNSSSASVDTRDTMAELARQIEPVERDGVEFAPFDDIHINLSNSYSMSVDVDDTIALDSALNQSIDKKIFMETPGSFSMSSWSQHTISADMFGSQSAYKSDGFKRDGLLLSRQAPSNESVTEQMLQAEEAAAAAADPAWNSTSLDLDLLDSHDHTQQTHGQGQNALFRGIRNFNMGSHSASNHNMPLSGGHHQHGTSGSHSSSNNNMGGGGSNGNGKPNRNNRPPLLSRNAKSGAQQKEFIGQVGSGAGEVDLSEIFTENYDNGGLGMLEAPPAATLSPQPQQHDVFAQQYAFPNTYSVARGNNSTSSQSGSPSSPSSPSYSYSSAEAAGNNTMGAYPFNPALSAVYDPSTGIVYYPHLPPGAVAVPVGGGMPTRLVPLGQSSEASVPVQAAYGRSDGSRTPEFSLVDDGAAGGGGGGGSCSGGGGRPAVVRKLSGSKAIYDSNISATIMHGSVGAQVKKDKKDKNRGSYRCGRCGKPKVNHVCAFVDTTTVSQAVQAKGPVLDPSTMQPFASDRVLTVNAKRKSIQDREEDKYANMGMIENVSRSGSLQFSFSRSNSGVTAESLVRSSSSALSSDTVMQRSASSALSDTLQRSASSVQSEAQLQRSHSGSDAIFPAFSRSGEDSLAPHPLSPASGSRPSVGFTEPLAQTNEQKEQIQQHLMRSESNDDDDVFFPKTFPPGGSGNLVFSSRNSSVNSTYGNDSDTSSVCGDGSSSRNQRSTLGSLFSSTGVDLNLTKFFRFTSSS